MAKEFVNFEEYNNMWDRELERRKEDGTYYYSEHIRGKEELILQLIEEHKETMGDLMSVCRVQPVQPN